MEPNWNQQNTHNLQNLQSQKIQQETEQLKEFIRNNVLKVQQVIQYGCKAKKCQFPVCANYYKNSGQITKEQATSLLLKILQQNQDIQSIQRIIDHLEHNQEIISINGPDFVNLLENCICQTNYTLLYNKINQIFKNVQNIQASFYKNNEKEPNESDPNIDYKNLKKFNQILKDLQDHNTRNQIKETIFSDQKLAFEQLIRDIQSNPDQSIDFYFKDERDMRVFLILLEIDDFLEIENLNYAHPMLKVISQLQGPQIKILTHWLKQYNKQEFEKFVISLQNLLTLKLINIEGPQDFNSIIKYITKLLEIFYQSNNQRTDPISKESFFNSTISSSIKAVDEFDAWLQNRRNKKHEFTFINYPFILETAYKFEVLQAETEFLKQLNFQESIRHMDPFQVLFQANQIYHFQIEVDRNNIIEDTLKQLIKPDMNFAKQLKVKFKGEQGVDGGGLRKEFFQLLSQKIFDPQYGMFVKRLNNRFLWFNSDTYEINLNFELLGMMLGLAIYNNIHLDLHFPLLVYKKLLDVPLTLNDLAEIEPELVKSFHNILEYNKPDFEDVMCLNFQINHTTLFGETITIDLIENGANIPLNLQNKQMYVDLYFDWYTNKSIKQQFDAFYKGFHKVMSRSEMIKLFSPDELHVLICGSQQLDFHELERTVEYKEGYTKESKTIKDFWQIVHNLTEEQKRKFLQFSTGTDRAPINGLGSLNFVIARHGPDTENLPSAHTCFNILELPDYQNYDKLKNKLIIAINNSEGFGFI